MSKIFTSCMHIACFVYMAWKKNMVTVFVVMRVSNFEFGVKVFAYVKCMARQKKFIFLAWKQKLGLSPILCLKWSAWINQEFMLFLTCVSTRRAFCTSIDTVYYSHNLHAHGSICVIGSNFSNYLSHVGVYVYIAMQCNIFYKNIMVQSTI